MNLNNQLSFQYFQFHLLYWPKETIISSVVIMANVILKNIFVGEIKLRGLD